MTLDEAVTYLREALDKVDPTVHTEFRMSPQEVEQLLYWLTEYKAMTSGRQSENLSERLAEHLVWSESNSYECPVTLAEDLQEAISDMNDKDKTISNLIENIKRLQSVSSWIPCSERMPDNADHKGAQCIKCMIMTKYGVTEGWYNPDYNIWFALVWYTSSIFFRDNLDMEVGDEPKVEILERELVSHWMPYPTPTKEVEE